MHTHQSEGGVKSTPVKAGKYFPCAFTGHRKDSVKHCTDDCKEFGKLSVQDKYELIKQINACFVCFGDHRRQQCPNKRTCSTCGKDGHHQLLCKRETTTGGEASTSTHHLQVETASNASQTSTLALYPIQQAQVFGTRKSVSIFCDGGSNTTYITHQAADRIGAKRLSKVTLEVTTMGNVEKSYDTNLYQFSLSTSSGKKVSLNAYGMNQITGPVSNLDPAVLHKLFPDYDPLSLQRASSRVDVLLGCAYFGLHPKQEEARCGEHLSIMRGELGICLQGTHPELLENTRYDSNLAKTVHGSKVKSASYNARLDAHPEFQPLVTTVDVPVCEEEGSGQAGRSVVNVTRFCSSKEIANQVENFVRGEELATETTPQCGGCRCGKCPTVGHTYSFKEEQDLKVIQENLEYDEEGQHWVTSYPWLVDPRKLPDNRSVALATLKSTERTLSKDERWAEVYRQQMQDMLCRGVAKELSAGELEQWKGPKFYLSHLAVVNPKSPSTPVRIVFKTSQVCEGVPLNSCLAKGPDCYMNNLLGVLFRWREGRVALVRDIRKMFNSIHLKDLEQHCHRFLWRGLQTDCNPKEYVITRVNFGDTPAPAISTEAIYKSAKHFKEDSPRTAELLKNSSYVDDLIDSFPSKEQALNVAQDVQDMLKKGGFSIKSWQISGEASSRSDTEVHSITKSEEDRSRSMLKGSEDGLRVLGVGWKPKQDIINFEVNLNFTRKKKGVPTGPNLTEADIPQALPTDLTRRIVLGQMLKIYDPLGLVCPFTLLGKIYLRDTCARNLEWDDPLPDDLRASWIQFFGTLFQLEQLEFDRGLCPIDAQGELWLIILRPCLRLCSIYQVATLTWKLLVPSYYGKE